MKTPTQLAENILDEYRPGEHIFDRVDVSGIIRGAVMLDRADALEAIYKIQKAVEDDPNYSDLNKGALMALDRLSEHFYRMSIQ